MKQTNMKRVVSAGLLGSGICLGVQADDTITLDPVAVWATEVQASSVHLDGEAIDSKQADHISDLLRTIPGVDVGGAHSLNQRITIRSMDDKDLKISIDGANQNTYMYHHMGNLQINANILKSAEIEVGNNSVVNGGLGGTIRFETKSASELLRPGQQFGAHVQATYATNASESYSVTGYGQITESVDVLGYYNLIQRDNYKVGRGEILDADGNSVDGTDGEVRGLEGELDDALLKFGWDITPGQRITLGYETYKDEGDYSYRPDMGIATDLAIANSLMVPLTYPTEFTRDTLTLNHDIELGETTLVKTTLFRNESYLRRDETGFSSSPVFSAFAGIVEGEASNTGLSVLANTPIESNNTHELTYGVEYIQYDTDYSARYTNGNSDDSSEEAVNAAVFIEDRIGFDNNVSVIPGVRYNHYDIDSTVVDDTFTKVTGALAIEYEPTQEVLLRASSTQLFKGPEIGEVFTGAGLGDTPNPDIEAETGFNHELSAAYQKVVGRDRFHTGITLFQTDINDYIYDYASTATFTGKDNIGDMQIRGFEAYFGFDVNQLNVLFTYSRARSDLSAFDEYSSLEGARLDRQQGDTISILADYAIPESGLTLHWDMLRVAKVEAALDLDGATKDNSKDAYMVHNIAARWTPAEVEGLTLTLGIDNLFDEYYASQSSRTGLSFHPRFGDLYLQDYEPGRNFKVTVGYQL
ncbi:TonB-dependent receptor domain-containing protein [Hahella ganghwensis]|uniref:TonB-dependent receptor domain-containing protein n=1 Tax=Hahella ganghwensis TaxID=286420 RepID=UPI00047839F5|nr:TonB-dependent receptor [Hahella ganghwensis]